MPDKQSLLTDRLILGPLREEHFEPFVRLNADPRVMEFFPAIMSRQDCERSFKAFSEHFEKYGWGFWSVSLQTTNEYIGMIGMQHVNFTAHFTPAVEIGWKLAVDHWGKGYASEGAMAALKYGFGTLKLNESYLLHLFSTNARKLLWIGSACTAILKTTSTIPKLLKAIGLKNMSFTACNPMNGATSNISSSMKMNNQTEGGVWQLWSLASILMLSSLSSMAMIFVDRLMLAKFSLEAHNAAIEAVNVGWAFQSWWFTLAGITQVFVAQYFGAGQHHALSRPVWQMMWLSLLSFLVFIPLALWSPCLVFDCEMKRSYLLWMMLFIPVQGMFSALTGYFIGQKQMSITAQNVFFGNILNFILAYVLIFGVEGFIPAYGITGAILATNIALLCQVALLFVAFWKQSKKFELKSGPAYKFDLSLFKKCFAVGFPNATFRMLDNIGWSLFYIMMASLGTVHITVAGIVQNVLILSFFFADGLWKAVATLVGNAIGSSKPEIITKIVKSSCILMTWFAVVLGLFLWFARTSIHEWFLYDLSEEDQALIYPALLFGLINAVIYKYLEGIRLSIGGALIAAADTKFLLVSGAGTVWLFMVVPIYFLVYLNKGSIELALVICSFYTLVSAIIFIWRFWRGKWLQKANIVDLSAQSMIS